MLYKRKVLQLKLTDKLKQQLGESNDVSWEGSPLVYKGSLQSRACHQSERGRLCDEVTTFSVGYHICDLDRIFCGSFDCAANAETFTCTNILDGSVI